ncbi:family 4 glycosyl hydrolase [Anaerorhabdus sp.]|uniref:family 4 glycosyl hydrolase n=1 Tax=Anaerorhabdus sp. TaxID=1872524 RepID=UPI002FCAE166
MKKYNVVICGGGSTYTPDMMELLVMLQKPFPLNKVVLYDIDAERQEVVGEFGRVLFKEYYPDVEFSYTTDKENAFDGIDFAFVQIRAGGLEQRKNDEQIPYKYGRIGQETCGAGGLSYGIRSVVQMIDLINDIREYSKEAWIINYSNPAAIVAEACKIVFPDDKKIVNICDMPTDVIGRYLPLVGKKRSEVDCMYFGLNHYGWFTKVLDKKTGKDILPDILNYVVTHYEELREEAKARIRGEDDHWGIVFYNHLTMIKDFPYSLPNTYNLYYMYPKLSYEHYTANHTRYDEVVAGREANVFSFCRKVASLGKMIGTEFDITDKISPYTEFSGEMNSETVYADNDVHAAYLVELVLSIINNKKEMALVMIKNDGIVDNLDPGMMLEATSIIGKEDIIPLKHGPIGQFEKGLLENQYACEKLLVEAILEHSDQKLLQAFTENRLIGDADVAKAMIKDFKEANGDYWPEFK